MRNLIDRDRFETRLGTLAERIGLVTREAVCEAATRRNAGDERDLVELLTEVAELSTDRAETLRDLATELSTFHQDGADEPPTGSGETVVSEPSGASAPSPSAPGAARYRAVAPLAEGGVGEVYLAHDLELDRPVALKEIRRPKAHDPKLRARFLFEARLTGSLEHPGIVPVYGLSAHDDGRPYYAMRLIRGMSLREALERHHRKWHDDPAVPPASRPHAGRDPEFRKLLRRFIDVCHTIDYVHSRGLLHRDLKPDNVMLGPYGETLVVDWGLAKPIGESRPEDAGPASSPTSLPRLDRAASTQVGSTLGTPPYMSPEQARGLLDELTTASDIYALGATLYAILTGEAPFAGTLDEILERVALGRFEPPRKVDRSLDPALESICLKAMATSPPDRYPDAGAIAEDLERWLADEPVSAHRDGWPRRLARWARHHRSAVLAGFATLALVATVAILALLAVLRARSGERRANLEVLRHAAEVARLAEAEHRQRLDVQRQLARIELERGLALCEGGDVNRGLLRLVAALESTPEGDEALTRVIRRNLTAWEPLATALRGAYRHPDWVWSMALASDGRRAVIGGKDGAARLWDLEADATIGTPWRHEGSVQAATFGPDGAIVVTGGRDGLIWRREAAGGGPIDEPLRLGAPVVAVAFPADGRFLMAATDREVRFFEPASGRPIGTPIGLDVGIGDAALDPSGTTVATAGSDGVVRLWNVETAAPIGRVAEHDGAITTVAFGPDGRLLATGGWDRVARVWDRETGRAVGAPMRHPDKVLDLAFGPDGRRLVTAGFDGVSRSWDVETGQPADAPLSHRLPLRSICIGPDGRTMLTGGHEGVARRWQLPRPGPPGHLLEHDGRVNALRFSPDGETLLTTGFDSMFRFWEAATGRPLGRARSHGTAIADATFSPDGRSVAILGGRTASIWEVGAAAPTVGPLGHPHQVRSVDYSGDGRRLLTAWGDPDLSKWRGGCRLWDVASGSLLREFRSPETGPITEASISPDGSTIVAGNRSSRTKLWDAATGAPIGPDLTNELSWTNLARFSPDGRLVLTGGQSGEVRLWEAATGLPHAGPMRHQGAVTDGCFDGPGTLVMTVGTDRVARFWGVADGRPRRRALTHPGPLSVGALDRDAATALIGGQDRTARLWDAEFGQPVGPAVAHPGWVTAAALDPLGRFAASGGEDGTVVLRPVPAPAQGSVDELRVRFETLTNQRLTRDGGFEHLSFDEGARRRAGRPPSTGGPPRPIPTP